MCFSSGFFLARAFGMLVHSGLGFAWRIKFVDHATRGLFRSSRAIFNISSGRLPSVSIPTRFSSVLASSTS